MQTFFVTLVLNLTFLLCFVWTKSAGQGVGGGHCRHAEGDKEL